jgi:ketosteroid isomerase-like protein
MFYETALKEGTIKDRLVVLDPDGRATAEVRVQALDSLKAEASKSVRAWAEAVVAKDSAARATKVRADSWQERTVAGKPGISFIADFEEANAKKVAYGVCTFGDKDAVLFNLEATGKDLEDLRPAFDGIVDSYKSK